MSKPRSLYEGIHGQNPDSGGPAGIRTLDQAVKSRLLCRSELRTHARGHSQSGSYAFSFGSEGGGDAFGGAPPWGGTARRARNTRKGMTPSSTSRTNTSVKGDS